MSQTQLTTFTDPATNDAIREMSNSYVDFTSSLITSTFDALVDANLKQMESYTEYVATLSKDLTTYINDTKDDVPTDEILNFLEGLDMEKFKLIGNDSSDRQTFLDVNDIGELVEVSQDNEIILRDDSGVLVQQGDDIIQPGSSGKGFAERLFGGLFGGAGADIVQTVGTVIKNVDIPEETGFGSIFNKIKKVLFPELDLQNPEDTSELTYAYPSSDTDKGAISKSLMDAMIIRIQKNKYDVLQTTIETGLLQHVIDGGHIKTGFRLQFHEKDTYKLKKKDTTRDRSKQKSRDRVKNKVGFLPFFKRKRIRNTKQKSTHFAVQKTKVNVTEKASVKASYLGDVCIRFSTNYKEL